MDDLIQITPAPIATSAADAVRDPSCGGIAVFLGCTRAQRHPDGRELLALDYEAYADMALRQMRDLADAARQKWPIVKLLMLHRTGRVGLGEPSVLIAVSTPHRSEAFEACRWLIDTLKQDVAVWKKEIWADGSGTWVHPNEQGLGSTK
jgi:molybdopterin synthase catalytic subunit